MNLNEKLSRSTEKDFGFQLELFEWYRCDQCNDLSRLFSSLEANFWQNKAFYEKNS